MLKSVHIILILIKFDKLNLGKILETKSLLRALRIAVSVSLKDKSIVHDEREGSADRERRNVRGEGQERIRGDISPRKNSLGICAERKPREKKRYNSRKNVLPPRRIQSLL